MGRRRRNGATKRRKSLEPNLEALENATQHSGHSACDTPRSHSDHHFPGPPTLTGPLHRSMQDDGEDSHRRMRQVLFQLDHHNWIRGHYNWNESKMVRNLPLSLTEAVSRNRWLLVQRGTQSSPGAGHPSPRNVMRNIGEFGQRTAGSAAGCRVLAPQSHEVSRPADRPRMSWTPHGWASHLLISERANRNRKPNQRAKPDAKATYRCPIDTLPSCNLRPYHSHLELEAHVTCCHTPEATAMWKYTAYPTRTTNFPG